MALTRLPGETDAAYLARQRAAASGTENVASQTQNLDAGKTLGGAAAGAAAGAPLGPIGIAGGAIIGALPGLFSDDDSGAPQAPPAEFAAGQGSDLTNHLAALQLSEGLSQQQAQNAREAAFYNQANQNYDLANLAQMREAGIVQGSPEDQARQLEALQRSSGLADTLTDMGTRAQGPSAAEAQLRQGLAASMAQQTAMARSGRTLGSGQASLLNAAYNNAALDQQTNQAAAIARIQEDAAYRQSQLNALQAAGQEAAQQAQQSNTIRAGNEALQQQNVANAQQQQQINNQTTGVYNTTAGQQQNLGMQANQLGQNAYQFGNTQGQNAQLAQLNATTGQTSSKTATNLANASAAERQNAANLNMATTGLGAAATALGENDAADAANAPKNPNEAYKNITLASNQTQGTPNQNRSYNDPRSDERAKTNIKPISTPAGTSTPGLITGSATKTDPYAGFSPEDAAAYKAADDAAKSGASTYTANGKTEQLFPGGKGTPMDEDTRKIAVTGEGGAQPDVASYLETVKALQDAYRKSQSAPADVLNRVPGAGAGPSDTQAALMAKFGKPQPRIGFTSPLTDQRVRGSLATAPTSTPVQTMLGGTPGHLTPAQTSAMAAPASNWGDVFNQPSLDPRVQNYLAGMSAQPAPAAPTPAPTPVSGTTAPSQVYNPYMKRWYNAPGSSGYDPRSDISSKTNIRPITDPRSDVGSKTNVRFIPPDSTGALSDDASKTRIRELEGQLAALGGRPSFTPQAPDTEALDRSEYGQQVRHPGVDFRNAYGYEYDYKNPREVGAAPGRQVGTMAQELERTVAAPYVHDTPKGKTVDTARLPLALAPAVGETQRRVDDLEAQLNALKGSGLGPMPAYRRDLYAQPVGVPR